MRKVLPVIVVCAMLIGMFAVAPVKHVYAVVPGFDSSIQVQNLSTTSIAHITLDYYLPDGTVDISASDTIDPSSSKTYLPIHPDAGFNGSVVISSDIPIATISNLTVTATNRALGTYDGVGGGGSVCTSHWLTSASMSQSLPSRMWVPWMPASRSISSRSRVVPSLRLPMCPTRSNQVLHTPLTWRTITEPPIGWVQLK